MRDWSAVPYPAWWIARAAERRIELDRAVDRIRTVVRESDDIVGALVFGSYATGKVGPESDLDVMLVTTIPANGDPGLRYALLINRLALGVPCDLLIYQPEEFARLSVERGFIAQAQREGIWIDATPSA